MATVRSSRASRAL